MVIVRCNNYLIKMLLALQTYNLKNVVIKNLNKNLKKCLVFGPYLAMPRGYTCTELRSKCWKAPGIILDARDLTHVGHIPGKHPTHCALSLGAKDSVLFSII